MCPSFQTCRQHGRAECSGWDRWTVHGAGVGENSSESRHVLWNSTRELTTHAQVHITIQCCRQCHPGSHHWRQESECHRHATNATVERVLPRCNDWHTFVTIRTHAECQSYDPVQYGVHGDNHTPHGADCIYNIVRFHLFCVYIHVYLTPDSPIALLLCGVGPRIGTSRSSRA